ncbi:SDR family NAD(P)-dependent oxidoreductase [Burkholderia pseudomallei]|uniref:SDR family NAD(P)-dependent oxidoreductase n=1 Tax=Burkholderia pseudomallei TaxID=28450 RepID=UPI003F65FC50
MVDVARFTGKVVIITGAGSGIGRASAMAFAREGAHVAVADISDRDGRETVQAIEASGGAANFYHVDVGSAESVTDLTTSVVTALGRLDVFFANAGIFDNFRPFLETSDDLWDRLVKVDLSGCFYSARASFPHLAESRGNLVITGSSASFRGLKGGVSYTAAKHGVAGLIKHLAGEFAADGVRVNGVAPGPIRTNIVRNLPEGFETDPDLLNSVPMGRWASPEEVAEPVLFLASPAASYITGVLLPVDGGLLSK